MPPGITTVHRAACPAHTDPAAACRCQPSYAAKVYDPRSDKRLRRRFKTQAEAKTWRLDTQRAVQRGNAPANRACPLLADAAGELVAGMRTGAVRTRSGDPYKPTVIYDYERALANDVTPVLGAMRLDQVRRSDVLRLVERLQGRGVGPSRLRNIIMPLRVIYRRAVELEQVTASPLAGLQLPASRGRRDRIATPEQAERLLAALAPADRATWALAFYGGLRLGEPRALRWCDVDFDAGLVRVERSWCNRSAQPVAPKSPAARRRVPMAGRLRQLLLERRLVAGRPDARDLVVAGRHGRPPAANTLANRARSAWQSLEGVPAGLTMHEGRHTYASLMIAAGVGAKPLSEFMGHSSITITIDRYGHLFPGAHAEAAQLLDRYLDAAGPRPLGSTQGTSVARQPHG